MGTCKAKRLRLARNIIADILNTNVSQALFCINGEFRYIPVDNYRFDLWIDRNEDLLGVFDKKSTINDICTELRFQDGE